MERPVTTTGGSQSWRISAAQSAAWVAIGQGGAVFETVHPTPRGSKLVLRKPGLKAANWAEKISQV